MNFPLPPPPARAAPILIKLGGAALQDACVLDQLAHGLRRLRAHGRACVVVHGGGPAINRELDRRGIAWRFVDGQRVTTPEMMDVIESTLGGLVNGAIVRALGARGVPAAGTSGTHAGMLHCAPAAAELGLVGRVTEVRPAPIRALLAEGLVPVIAPVGVGAAGEAFNVNADWAAARIAEAIGAARLVFLTDQPGVLDVANGGAAFADLDEAGLEGLIQSGVVSGGMLAKTRTILHALRAGVPEVHVLQAATPLNEAAELGRWARDILEDRGSGTRCRLATGAPSLPVVPGGTP